MPAACHVVIWWRHASQWMGLVMCVQEIVDLWDKVLDGYADLTVVRICKDARGTGFTARSSIAIHGQAYRQL